MVIQSGAAKRAAEAFRLNEDGSVPALRADRLEQVFVSPELLTSAGFGSLSIDNSDGRIFLPGGVKLIAAAGGTLSLTGANLEIDGELSAPGGNIALTAYNVSPFTFARLKTDQAAVTPAPNAGRGAIVLGSGAILSTAGLVIDDRRGLLSTLDRPMMLRGYSAALAKGSLLDASGGVFLDAKGAATYGLGGHIEILAGQDPELRSVVGGALDLQSTLRAYSGSTGGSLSIQAMAICVGTGEESAEALSFAPSFFTQGGFTNYALAGLSSLTVESGSIIAPTAQNYLAAPHAGEEGGVDLQVILRPNPALRRPVSLAFSAPGVRDTFNGNVTVRGDLSLESGAVLRVDPGASIGLTGDTASILGSAIAPGGNIVVSGGRDSTRLFADIQHALPTVFIGPQAVLNAAGTAQIVPDAYGNRQGSVLAGGSISVSGNLVTAPGAVLDVSGASATLELPPAMVQPSLAVNGFRADGTPLLAVTGGLTTPINRSLAMPVRVESDAGSITLSGGQLLHNQASLLGRPGGASALGGSLTVSSGRFYAPDGGQQPTPLDVTLQVTQNTTPLALSSQPIGHALSLAGLGYFGVDRFSAGGFDSLTLRGTVDFSGPVSIQARRELSVADAGVLYTDSATTLTAPYVKLGTPFQPPVAPEQVQPPFQVGGQPFRFPPTFGSGSLTVRAGLIDVGNLVLQNTGNLNLLAENGDIRGAGTLEVAGHISLRAAQIYPPTAQVFTMAAADYAVGGSTLPGSVTITSGGTSGLPLSAGGQLNVYGSVITQGGTLRAPLGGITLGWDGTGTAPIDPITGQAYAVAKQLTLTGGSLTSVSAIDPLTGEGALIPYGLILNGISWIDPRGLDITAGGVSTKTVNIAGLAIDDQAGSRIDLRGGGDLYAFRFIKGLGGSKDILTSSGGFAIMASYTADYAPYAPFNPSPVEATLGGDAGYANSTLQVGDRIYLGASAGLPAGYYTLLPARYALLPGAFLVTPKTGLPTGANSMTTAPLSCPVIAIMAWLWDVTCNRFTTASKSPPAMSSACAPSIPTHLQMPSFAKARC